MIAFPLRYQTITSRLLDNRRHRKTKAHAALQVWMNAQLERDVADEKRRAQTRLYWTEAA